MSNKNATFVFFGTSEFSVIILDELKVAGFLPSLIVTVEDKPKGRKLVLTAPETKVWAQLNTIPYIQPKSLRKPEGLEELLAYTKTGVNFFVVASYGKILPQSVLDIPKLGTLNVHPSLLPKLRGASPIESAILTENETGVTIMRLDADMDHGPIVAQEKIEVKEWPPYFADLEKSLGENGGKLLANILPDWLQGKITEREQEHTLATFCGKIEKTDGEINLADDAEKNLRKIHAYHVWPGAYFFKNGKRIVVKRAHTENGELILDRIIPEGKKEMSYADYLRGLK